MLSQTEWANKQIQGIIQALHADLISAKSQDANLSQYIGKLVSSIQSPVSGGVPKLVVSSVGLCFFEKNYSLI